MRTVGFYTNPEKPDAPQIAGHLLEACVKAGLTAVVEPWLARALGDPRALCREEVALGVDVLAVLGGDGTLLRAMPMAVAHDVPLLGLNLGRVGFLTELEARPAEDAAARAAALEAAMRALAEGDYRAERRMLLSVTSPDGAERLALNEAMVARVGGGGVPILDAYLGGALIDRYAADGLIVATPTGSTAYSLSAGGPIVAPDLPGLVLVPVCPHSLRARPMVLSAEGVLRIHVRDARSAGSVLLTTDGQIPFELSTGDDVLVRRAGVDARFVRLGAPNFFALLRAKLSEWSI